MASRNHTEKYYPWIVEAMLRDHYACVDCGVRQDKGHLVVHHIDESRKTGFLNNNLENLVTLCRPCHARRHGFTSVRQDVSEMRRMGLSLTAIGNKLGVSRQRVYQIIRKQTNWKEIEAEYWSYVEENGFAS